MKLLALIVLLCGAIVIESVELGKSKTWNRTKETLKKILDRKRTLEVIKGMRSMYYFQPPDYGLIRSNYDEEQKEMEGHYKYTEMKTALIAKLGHIGVHLRLFKHWSKDPRGAVDAYREFPVPFFKKLHPDVVSWCNTSLFNCINNIHQRIIDSSFWLEESFYDDVDDVVRLGGGVEGEWLVGREVRWRMMDALGRPEEMFFFSISASYYLCWFTLNHFPITKHLPYSDYDSFALKGLVFPKFYSAFSGEFIIDRLNTLPYETAKFSFCPDPCCGRFFQRENQMQGCLWNSLNPCHSLHNPQCSLPDNLNTDFVDIVRNNWNVSCLCDEGAGFRWDNSLGKCHDIDECLDGTHNCRQDQVCMNTVGWYLCLCGVGEREEGRADRCVAAKYRWKVWYGPADVYLSGGRPRTQGTLALHFLCIICGGLIYLRGVVNE